MANLSATKPIPLAILTEDVITRFHGKYTVDDDGCWRWRRLAKGDRYARLKIKGGMYSAHRVSYVIATGADVPTGLELDHLCRDTSCVNPSHLEPVTHRENVRRGDAPSALTIRAIEETGRCPNGHDMALPNAWFTRPLHGRRECRACKYAHKRAARTAA